MITISKSKYLYVILYLQIIFINSGPAQAMRPDSLFRSDEIIHIELKSDFTAILKERTVEPVVHKGILTYKNIHGKNVKLNVEVTSRGNFRRDPANCDFPPLLINFSKKGTKKSLFKNQDKLKLVTSCKFDRDVIQEYLVYKMYNLLTEKSLNARLVSITYFDTGKNKKLFEKYSFFIEDEDRAAMRNNAIEIKKVLTPFDLDSVVFRNMAFFQYMIGNKDWYVTSRKNIVMMQPADSLGAPFPVPYDFDFAGFVDADYTRPSGVSRELLEDRRVFKGICYDDNEINETIAYFKSLRPAFESLIRNMQLLPRSIQTEKLSYLREFYSAIENPRSIREKFLASCETKADYNIR
jgi:hypothetical protein